MPDGGTEDAAMSGRGYTARQLLACAVREVGQRARVYPRFVEKGSMSQAQADLQIDMMEAIAEHFAEMAEKERLL
jgi:hypothetical protein